MTVNGPRESDERETRLFLAYAGNNGLSRIRVSRDSCVVQLCRTHNILSNKRNDIDIMKSDEVKISEIPCPIALKS
jgi:hypothetical protein